MYTINSSLSLIAAKWNTQPLQETKRSCVGKKNSYSIWACIVFAITLHIVNYINSFPDIVFLPNPLFAIVADTGGQNVSLGHW